MNKILLVTFTVLTNLCFAQTETAPRIFRIASAYTSFPDTGRIKGHSYDNVFYSTAEHYADSSVLIIVPAQLKVKQQADVICWFHGWRNNIDSAAVRFELIRQFLASHCNAILIFPETTKDAPDSYGGKLEQKDTFKQLLQEVLDKLKKERIIGKRTTAGNVVLAGHSGAFRVMAHILQQGGVEIKQTILFDGLYSQIDKFSNWIGADISHRFIHLYTNKGGGTDEVSAKMMKMLTEKNIHYINPKENEVNAAMLKTNKVIFIHSLKEHDDVINRPDYNFQLFIENSPVLKALH